MFGQNERARGFGGDLSRRSMLGLGLGVVGSLALAGCSGAKADSTAHAKLLLPNYTPPRSMPGSTISRVPGVGPAFDSYPMSPYKSVAAAPGSGGPVTTFQILYPAPPPPLASNQWWQEYNKRLNVQLQPTLAPYLSYATKIQTMVASGDIADITWIEPGQGVQSIVRTLQEGAFTDLTDILAGDGIKAYPNLAQIPTYAWKNCAIENTIYGIPRPEPLLISEATATYRMDWAKAAGFPDAPTNADEFFQLMTGISGNGRYGMGAIYQRWFYMMFGVPNNWSVDAGGNLTNMVEVEQTGDALAYANKLWKAGAFHPDAPTQAWTQQAEQVFLANKTGMFEGGMGSQFGLGNVIGNFRTANPDVELAHLVPMGHDGGKPSIYQASGYFGISSIPSSVGKDSKRLTELLKVLDYWAAPFGSEEFLFINFGDEGRHFTFDSSHNPVPSTSSVSQELNLNYMNQPRESVNYFPGVPGDSVAAQKLLEQAAQSWIPDPTQGLVSDTFVKQAAELKQISDDFEMGIITGRRPISDLKTWRSEWKAGGGDKIRKEFEASLQRAKSHG